MRWASCSQDKILITLHIITYFIYVFLLIRKRIIFILYVFGALTHLVCMNEKYFLKGEQI